MYFKGQHDFYYLSLVLSAGTVRMSLLILSLGYLTRLICRRQLQCALQRTMLPQMLEGIEIGLQVHYNRVCEPGENCFTYWEKAATLVLTKGAKWPL